MKCSLGLFIYLFIIIILLLVYLLFCVSTGYWIDQLTWIRKGEASKEEDECRRPKAHCLSPSIACSSHQIKGASGWYRARAGRGQYIGLHTKRDREEEEQTDRQTQNGLLQQQQQRRPSDQEGGTSKAQHQLRLYQSHWQVNVVVITLDSIYCDPPPPAFAVSLSLCPLFLLVVICSCCQSHSHRPPFRKSGRRRRRRLCSHHHQHHHPHHVLQYPKWTSSPS